MREWPHLASGEAYLLLAYLPVPQRDRLTHALDCPDCRLLLDELLQAREKTTLAAVAGDEEPATLPAAAPLPAVRAWVTIASIRWSEGNWAETRTALEHVERALVLAEREAASPACRDLFAAVRLSEEQIGADFAIAVRAMEELLRCALDATPAPPPEETTAADVEN